jgi:NAD(P)-dependent dehydrogenase (short-subunit alcohol dehydrogenase family)
MCGWDYFAEMRGLRDKVAVVAGGAGGIGTASSIRLAEEGVAVVVGDLNGDAARAVAVQITEAGGRAIPVAFDIADEDSVVGLIATAVDEFGGLDLLHCNAAALDPGTIGQDTDIETVSLDVFDRTLAVDLRGHVLCTRHTLPELVARGGGAIVYTASAAAFIGEPQRPSYAIAKSGLTALARHVASRWGKEGIRANAVAPGLILTPAVRAGSMANHVLARVPHTRLGEPTDIAAAVAFLLSDDADWVNGQVLSVDGGSTMR